MSTKVYITDADRLTTLALAGVQATCEWVGQTWPDRIFDHMRENDSGRMAQCYASDLSSGLRFYIETE